MSKMRPAPATPKKDPVAEHSKIRILLVDDHPFVLEGLRSFLANRPEFDVVGEAANGREAIDKCEQLRPTVVVMDVTMPVLGGIEATRHLRQICPEVRVLVLTVHQKREFASQVVASGAWGYLNKTSAPAELIKGIKAVAAGQTYFPTWVSEGFVQQYARSQSAGDPTGPRLSLREREVVALVAEGFSNKEAAAMLGISARTVEKHRERVMEKLKLKSVVELTKYAIAEGIIEMR